MEPRVKRRRDLITVAVLLVFSAFYLYLTFEYSPGSEAPGLPNSRTLPKILTGMLVLLSLGLLWQARSPQEGDEEPVEAEEGDHLLVEEFSTRRLGLVLGMLIVYLIAFPYVGFLISTILLGVALQTVVFRVSWVRSILISVFVSGLTYWIFAILLGVLLP